MLMLQSTNVSHTTTNYAPPYSRCEQSIYYSVAVITSTVNTEEQAGCWQDTLSGSLRQEALKITFKIT